MRIKVGKLLETAQQLAQKGEYDKAIAAFTKLLTVRKDAGIYNTIGDLHLKRGSRKDAAQAFSMAAELYREDGFYPKAAALYKKILTIIPFDVNAMIASADISAEQGLHRNAAPLYLKAAERLTREKKVEKAIDIFRRVLAISPHDIATRSRLADILLKRNLKVQAASEYVAVASLIEEKGHPHRARKFYRKALTLDPQNAAAKTGLDTLPDDETETKDVVIGQAGDRTCSLSPGNSVHDEAEQSPQPVSGNPEPDPTEDSVSSGARSGSASTP